MNTNFENNINRRPGNLITPDEYYKLIKKEGKLSIDEEIDVARYPDYLSNTAQSVVGYNNEKAMGLATQGTLTQREQQVLNRFNSNTPYNNPSNPTIGYQNGYTRTRSIRRAGYINATILLTMLLNIGFILAMTFISK